MFFFFKKVLTKNYSIAAKDYTGKLPEIGSLRLATFTSVGNGLNETLDSSPSYNEHIVILDKPVLDIQTKSRVFYPTKANRVLLRMRNPLDRALTNCRLFLKDGLMCEEHKEVPLTGKIGAFATLTHEEQFAVPHGHGGKSLLVALLDCDQLHDVRGHLEITVKRSRNVTLPAIEPDFLVPK